MAAIDPKSLTKYIGYCYVTTKPTTWVTTPLTDANVSANLTAMQNLTRSDEFGSLVELQTSDDFAANLVQVDTDTHGTVYKASLPDITRTFNWREVFTENIVSLISNYSDVVVAGTPTAITDEALWTWWTVWTPIKLANKNGDKTIIDLTTAWAIKAGGWNLVRWTDFNDYVDSEGFTYVVPVTTQTLVLTATYSYTPNASDISYLNAITQELPELCLKIIAYDGNIRGTWNTIEMYLYDTNFTGQLVRAFQDVQRAGDINWSTMEFKANKNGFVILNDAITV